MVNEKQKSYIVELKEINDGSGDMILELPPEVIEGLGWKMGDTVSYEVRDKSIFVKKKEWVYFNLKSKIKRVKSPIQNIKIPQRRVINMFIGWRLKKKFFKNMGANDFSILYNK